MKIDFERESTGRELLPPQQRAAFFERMKGVIVLIETELKPTMPEPESSIKREKFGKPKWRKLSDSDETDETKKLSVHGTGFFFNSNGLILTAGHVVPENCGAVRFWVEDDDIDIEDATDAEVVSAHYQLDLAILKPKKNYTSNFATFREDTLNIGTEAFLIGHPLDLYFSCLVGEVVASERLYRDIYRPPLLDLNGDLRIVQINNLHALRGASGGPVFDSSGKVVGVLAFRMDGYGFAIHFSTLRQFCEQFSESRHPGSQKRKDKKFLKEERRREKAKRHWKRKKK